MAKLISEWINRVEQDGMVNIDLHITDLENEISEVTIQNSFKAEIVNDHFLTDEAEREMTHLIHTFLLEKQKYAALDTLSDEDKDRILLAWARSLPEDQRNKILLDGMN
jgi:hypothetical protein